MHNHAPRGWSLTAALCLAFAASSPAQNVTLLGKLDSRAAYAGIWGLDTPDGRTFVAMGERTGIMIIDVTNPAKPKEVLYMRGPSSIWRDATVYKGIVYTTSENHSGLRMADMTNPSKPVDMGYQHQSSFGNCHTISLDPDAGHIYANGTNRGVLIFDVKTDPKKPKLIGRFTTAYAHDSYVRRGTAYFSEIRNGRIRIADVRNLSSIKTISTFATPRTFAHNSWCSEDDKILLTTDERNRGTPGFVQAYDISTPSRPVALGSYKVSGAVVHNVYITGRTGYIAHYSDGFHVIDLADPKNIRRVARYDTSSSTSGYNGAWGAWVFADSGVAYVSDFSGGLFCFQVDCGHMNRFGAGTKGTQGLVPRARFDGGVPRVAGSKLRLELSQMRPSSQFVVMVSTKKGTGGKLLGAPIHVDLPTALFFYGQSDANGRASLPAGLPDNSALANQRLYAQILVADPNGPQGIAASRGMWAGVCSK